MFMDACLSQSAKGTEFPQEQNVSWLFHLSQSPSEPQEGVVLSHTRRCKLVVSRVYTTCSFKQMIPFFFPFMLVFPTVLLI